MGDGLTSKFSTSVIKQDNSCIFSRGTANVMDSHIDFGKFTSKHNILVGQRQVRQQTARVATGGKQWTPIFKAPAGNLP